jgi:outer membrane protein OmpA-like peptidoglycan-associated protein
MSSKTISFIFFVFISSILSAQTESVRLYFKSDCSSLSGVEQRKLTDFTGKLNTDSILEVHIVAYCDDLGTVEYNDVLSQKRAESLIDYLGDLGVKDDLIQSLSGRGELPIDSQSIESIDNQRALNRRTEVVFGLQRGFTVFNYLNVGDVVKLKDLYFKTSRHALMSKSIIVLDELHRYLINYPTTHILIIGYVAKKGVTAPFYDAIDEDTGLSNLSEARAKAIFDYLVDRDIDSERLSYEGRMGGFSRNGTKSRKVEIEVMKK